MGGKRRMAAAVAVVAGAGVALASVLPAQAMGPARGLRAAPAAAETRAAAPDRTDPAEAARVDRVKVRLAWTPCVDTPKIDYDARALCATAALPLDYDDPRGPTVEVAVVKIPARQPARRIGSLFVNPGGPGGSAVAQANFSPQFYSDEMQSRFDVVGMDPRGIGFSQNVRCFRSTQEQVAAALAAPFAFPVGPAEIKQKRLSTRLKARGCSTTGLPLSAHISTANVARDLDVLRRAVGDRRMTFLGLSYGSYMGQTYANMFPDRVRAIAIDGVLDGVAWAGTPATAQQVQDDRLRTAEGSAAGLHELLVRCAKVGKALCALADRGDPEQQFELLVRRVKAKPIVVTDPQGETTTYSYAQLVGTGVGYLYARSGTEGYLDLVAQLLVLSDPASTATARRAATRAVVRAQGELAAAELGRPPARMATGEGVAGKAVAGVAAPADDYDNGYETYEAVVCLDGLHPASFRQWVKAAEAADRRVPYFGANWVWSSSTCDTTRWTVRDGDVFRGPFDRRTSGPVLVVGNYYDPATPYSAARSVARRMPNSGLLTNDAFGHTAYGFANSCATSAIDTFLLRATLPRPGAVCVSDAQPFEPPPPGAAARLVGPSPGVVGRPLPGGR